MAKETLEVKLRKAEKSDMPAVLQLIKQLAEYEKAPQEVTVTVDELKHDGFTANLFTCIVAEMDAEIVGMALYYPRYSTWKGRTIHLEDFIVQEEHRKKGIGKKLFDAVIVEAQKFGAKRMEWVVLEWNTPALNFYDKINAHYEKDWFLAQLREKQIQNYSPGNN
jgi:GNAT superfamily N-acetyltransferase